MDGQKIKRSRAKCLVCGSVVESEHRHDFRSCSCGAMFLDGGTSYVRIGGDLDKIEVMTEMEEATDGE